MALRTTQATSVIEGHRTELVATRYANCVFIVVTQRDKLGSIMRVDHDAGVGRTSTPQYTVSHLFGQREEVALDVCARQIAEGYVSAVSGDLIRLPYLISLALKKCDRATVQSVIALVGANRV